MGIGNLCCKKKPTFNDDEMKNEVSFPEDTGYLSNQNSPSLKIVKLSSNRCATIPKSQFELAEVEDKRTGSVVPVECLAVPDQLPEKLSGSHISDISSKMLAGLITSPNKGLIPSPNKRSLFHEPTNASEFGRASSAYNLTENKGHTHMGLVELNLPKSSPELNPGISSWTQNKNNSPSEILPNLWLGTKMDSINDTKLKVLGITHILSVTSGKQHEVPNCELLSVPMADNGNTDLATVMEKVFPFIDKSQRGNNRLLVHCNLGQNRSPTIVISWLMLNVKKYNSLFKAYRFVKNKRMMVQPHKSYIKQLRSLDLKINKIYSTPDDFLHMSYFEGNLDIAHEAMSAYESTNYIRSQLEVMSTERRNSYNSHQVTTDESEEDDDDNTYQSASHSSKVIMPAFTVEDGDREKDSLAHANDTEFLAPHIECSTSEREHGSNITR